MTAFEPSEKFAEFRQRVLAAPALLERLRNTRDTMEFFSATIEAARDMGIVLTQEEIEVNLRAARQEWIERWLQ